jgi:hypothetical protein
MTESDQNARRPEPDARRLLAALEEERSPTEAMRIKRLYVDAFRGQSVLVNVGGFTVAVGLTVLAVFAAVRFLGVPEADVRGAIFWATLFLFATSQIVLMKVWFWLNYQRNAITREIKRLELRLTLQERV